MKKLVLKKAEKNCSDLYLVVVNEKNNRPFLE